MSETLRQISKREFSSTVNSCDEINCGSLQRIADAVEVVANNYIAIINERNFWRTRANEREEQIVKLTRSYSALRANYTRLKAKIKTS